MIHYKEMSTEDVAKRIFHLHSMSKSQVTKTIGNHKKDGRTAETERCQSKAGNSPKLHH
jgi:hypothetical protein